MVITVLRGLSVSAVTFSSPPASRSSWPDGRTQPGARRMYDWRLRRLDRLRPPRHLCGHADAGAHRGCRLVLWPFWRALWARLAPASSRRRLLAWAALLTRPAAVPDPAGLSAGKWDPEVYAQSPITFRSPPGRRSRRQPPSLARLARRWRRRRAVTASCSPPAAGLSGRADAARTAGAGLLWRRCCCWLGSPSS